MNHDNENPLHSARQFARQLRTASNRLFRNIHLSSAWQNDSNDVE